ncbi:hypothetical protein Tco_0045357, partial [Tanacetum coccineum]
TLSSKKEELSDFLTTYPIPSEYKLMLPKSNQTILEALDGYVGLYTYCFSLANLRLPLLKFFCDVLQYFHVHISRLNPFGYTKLTTFAVICKTYGCEPSVDLFQGFFTLFPGSKWLNFSKRPMKHIPNLMPKVITRIEEMAFRNFHYAKTDKDLTFPPKDPSPEFGTISPSVSINAKLPIVDAEPAYEVNTKQIIENVADSGGSLMHQEKLVIHPGSVAERIKDRKYRTKGGSSKLPVKPRLVQGAFSSRATRQKTASSNDDSPFLTISDDDEGLLDVIELQDANACHLKISNITPLAWRGPS